MFVMVAVLGKEEPFVLSSSLGDLSGSLESPIAHRPQMALRWPLTLKGTSNCLAEFEKNIETASQILLNFLHDLRGILPEIDINLPCSFPPWSVTNMVELNYRFLWKAPNFS